MTGPDADHPLVQLTKLVYQRGEVGVAGADGDVVTKPRSKASWTASTAILMSAAFLRDAPIRCGISISSTWALASSRRSSSKFDQSA